MFKRQSFKRMRWIIISCAVKVTLVNAVLVYASLASTRLQLDVRLVLAAHLSLVTSIEMVPSPFQVLVENIGISRYYYV